MREVAKSMLGFSWAVSLFGAQQIAKLVTPASGSSDTAEAMASQFDAATRAMQSFMTETVAEQFRAGDAWQRRMVDTLCDAATLQGIDPQGLAETLDPRPFLDTLDARQVLKTGVDKMQQSFDSLRQTVQAV